MDDEISFKPVVNHQNLTSHYSKAVFFTLRSMNFENFDLTFLLVKFI